MRATPLPLRLLSGLALALAAADARAEGALVAGQFLAGLGLVGGAIGGGIAGWRRHDPTGFGISFLVYLGLVCVVASTWSGSFEIVPLTLVFGAVAGILPFAASFFSIRKLVTVLSRRLRSKPPPA